MHSFCLYHLSYTASFVNHEKVALHHCLHAYFCLLRHLKIPYSECYFNKNKFTLKIWSPLYHNQGAVIQVQCKVLYATCRSGVLSAKFLVLSLVYSMYILNLVCLVLGLVFLVLGLVCLVLSLVFLVLGLVCLVLGLVCLIFSLVCLILGLLHKVLLWTAATEAQLEKLIEKQHLNLKNMNYT